MRNINIIILSLISVTRGYSMDGCPPVDPNCHPSCIVYTAQHCRLCRCAQGSTDSRKQSNSDFGSSGDSSWDKDLNGDWSSNVGGDSDSWRSSGSGTSNINNAYSDSGNKDVVKYILVEKESDNRYSGDSYSSPMSFMETVPNRGPSGGSPFGPSMSSSVLPGSQSALQHVSGPDVIHVPLISPGQPKYCVRCRILSCPSTCERMDEFGCRSCPCAPSRYQTMPVLRDCSEDRHHDTQPDCSTTKLCMESCKEGFHLGDVGRDGCRSCTCIRREPKHDGCPATLSCMLKCKDGYILGDKQANGCPSCKCLGKGHQANSNNTGSTNHNNNVNNGGTDWSGGGGNSGMNGGGDNGNGFGSGNGGMNGDGGGNSGNGVGTGNSAMNGGGGGNKGSGCKGSNSFLTSTNGLGGGGKCEPPMCIDGHMSIDEAMHMGSASVGGAGGDSGGCNDGGKDGHTGNGPFSTSMQSTSSGSSSSNGFGMNFGSMGQSSSMNGGGGMGGGGGSMGGLGMGGGGGGMGGGGGGGGGMGAFSASGSGMPSPFSVSASGGDKNGGMNAFRPFEAAISGKSSDEDSSMTSYSGSAMTSYSGAGMTSRGGSAMSIREHTECPELLSCLVTCGSSYILGGIDEKGCQVCTCS